ncbi:protein IN2-1 homolog B-like, partial [Triticum dicoccoides]|uniref:protein IN2-1 homolog B-like n=3 Tax=Triticum dicoccoides TaxID=85692 RepID=UPI00188DE95F
MALNRVTMAAGAAVPVISAGEDLPADLTSASSEPSSLFDGTTRLYVAYHCPYAQRVWIARNCKGLQGKIKIVALDLMDRPAWYKNKVYPENKVPALEYNKQVKGESLNLLKYIDDNFDGPELLPHDSAKKKFAEELLAYSDSFNASAFFSCLRSKGDVTDEVVAAVDKIEAALGKFSDGPFFLDQFSLVDIAYVPFIERLQISYSGIKNYDIVGGRPNLGRFIE